MDFLQVSSADPARFHLHKKLSATNARPVNIGELKSSLRINVCSFQGAAKLHV
jgi:hypothetical protein